MGDSGEQRCDNPDARGRRKVGFEAQEPTIVSVPAGEVPRPLQFEEASRPTRSGAAPPKRRERYRRKAHSPARQRSCWNFSPRPRAAAGSAADQPGAVAERC